MSGSQSAGLNEPAPEQRSERLTVAALRSAIPGRMWGGKGCGAPCDYCRVLVSAEEIGYEVEARVDGEIFILHFPPRCYDAWRTRREPPAAQAPAPTPEE